MKVIFSDRSDAYRRFGPLNVRYQVERYSRAAVGGPLEAVINATGPDVELWELFERLRCPVTIYSDLGDALWWGYINQIEATIRNPASRYKGYVRAGASLDTFANRIAIAYTEVDVEAGTETRQTTAWADDLVSQSVYGVKELLQSGETATAGHATAARDRELAQRKYPIPVVEPAQAATTSNAVLYCKGWWSTLEWQYYANAGTALVDTAAQVAAICTNYGQFFGTAYQDAESGLVLSQYNAGDNTALFAAEQLLETGTTNSRRLLVDVDQLRNVRIYEEPALITPKLLTVGGDLYEYSGSPIRPETCPVAFWAKMADLFPASTDTSLLADPSIQFIEQMEYTPHNNRLVATPRGHLSAWDFPRAKDG